MSRKRIKRKVNIRRLHQVAVNHRVIRAILDPEKDHLLKIKIEKNPGVKNRTRVRIISMYPVGIIMWKLIHMVTPPQVIDRNILVTARMEKVMGRRITPTRMWRHI